MQNDLVAIEKQLAALVAAKIDVKRIQESGKELRRAVALASRPAEKIKVDFERVFKVSEKFREDLERNFTPLRRFLEQYEKTQLCFTQPFVEHFAKIEKIVNFFGETIRIDLDKEVLENNSLFHSVYSLHTGWEAKAKQGLKVCDLLEDDPSLEDSYLYHRCMVLELYLKAIIHRKWGESPQGHKICTLWKDADLESSLVDHDQFAKTLETIILWVGRYPCALPYKGDENKPAREIEALVMGAHLKFDKERKIWVLDPKDKQRLDKMVDRAKQAYENL